jgi:hypothetical protein
MRGAMVRAHSATREMIRECVELGVDIIDHGEEIEGESVAMVGVNVPIPVPIAYFTFGGWKRSGFGDLNQHGADAFRFYTKTKTVTSRWPSGIKDGASFVIPTMH